MRGWLWPVIILGAALLVVWSVTTSWAVRPLITFGFVLVCPGMAVVRFMRLADPLTELGLAIGLSLAITLLGLEVMLSVQRFSSVAALAVLVAFSVTGALCQLAIVLRQRNRSI